MLFNLPKFRDSINELKDVKDKIILELQKVFHKLENEEDVVDTLDLRKSFGWGPNDNQETDLNELFTTLMDVFSKIFKGTKMEGICENLFYGTFVNYIKCINVDYESKREEDFLTFALGNFLLLILIKIF